MCQSDPNSTVCRRIRYNIAFYENLSHRGSENIVTRTLKKSEVRYCLRKFRRSGILILQDMHFPDTQFLHPRFECSWFQVKQLGCATRSTDAAICLFQDR